MIAGWLLGRRPEWFVFGVFVEGVDDGEAAVDFVHDWVLEVEGVVYVAVVDEPVLSLPDSSYLVDGSVVSCRVCSSVYGVDGGDSLDFCFVDSVS